MSSASIGYRAPAINQALAPRASGPFAGDPRPISRIWLAFWALAVVITYALLWSRYWYPLSDSSLYLSMARSWAAGRGLTMMGDEVRLVPPLTPLMLGIMIKMGMGIGAIQGVLILLMLASHALCFLTLRRWSNERLALWGTIACALSYWVFRNAFTIMSEPLCVALLWGGFLALSYVRIESGHRWWLILLGCVLLLGAAANRDAVLCLLPGPLIAMAVAARRRGRWARESFVWAALFAVVFGSWMLYRYPPRFLRIWLNMKVKVLPGQVATTTTGPTTHATTGPTAAGAKPGGLEIAPEAESEAEFDANPREGRYKTTWMVGVPRDVQHMLTEPPVLGGRWVCEGMAMASVAFFESKSLGMRIVGTTAALGAFALTILGGMNLFLGGRFWLLNFLCPCYWFLSRRRGISLGLRWRVLLRYGRWWVLGPALYFLIIWLQWGNRIIPRYMVPMAPVMFLFLWSGTTWVLVRVGRLMDEAVWSPRTVGRIVMAGLIGAVVLGNLFPWAVEAYVRHGTTRDFYEVTRRSAYAGLVDIGDWAQKHVAADEAIWMNAGAHRRIAYFLSGRRIDVNELPVADWHDWDLIMKEHRTALAITAAAAIHPTTGPSTAALPAATQPIFSPRRRGLNMAQRRKRFLDSIPRSAKYVIIMIDHPKKGSDWPTWHLPFDVEDRKAEWWRLYERQADDTWKIVRVPPSRDYAQSIPAIGN